MINFSSIFNAQNQTPAIIPDSLKVENLFGQQYWYKKLIKKNNI